jgi:hypothetical protein
MGMRVEGTGYFGQSLIGNRCCPKAFLSMMFEEEHQRQGILSTPVYIE